MPGFGGFAAVPGGYNEAEMNQQYVQALILDLQQKRQQQAAGGLAASALGIGAQQPIGLPGAQTLPPGVAPPNTPAGLPSAGVLPPPSAPGAGTGGPPPGPAPGAPSPAPMPNAVPAGGMVPGNGSIVGAGGGPAPPAGAAPGATTLAQIGTQLNAPPQVVASVAQTLSVQPNQPLSPTLADRAKQLLTSGAGAPVQTAALPPPGGPAQGGIPGAQTAPGAGGTVSPPGGGTVSPSGPIQPHRVQSISIPGAQPPPGAGQPGAGPPQQLAQAGAPGQAQGGQLTWRNAIDWINQAAAQQEQATGRKVSPQEKWAALQQMVPLMNMDAKAQYDEALVKIRQEHEQTYSRGEADKAADAARKREIDLMREQNRYNAKQEDLRIKQEQLDLNGRKLEEQARRTDLTAEQKKAAQASLDRHREAQDALAKEYKEAEIEHKKRQEDIQIYGIETRADTAAAGQETTRRGQDIRADTAAAGQETTRRGQDIRADTAAGAQQTQRDIATQRTRTQGEIAKMKIDAQAAQTEKKFDHTMALAILKEDRKDWRASLNAETKKSEGAMNREARMELAEFIEGRKDERAEMSTNLQRELKKAGFEARLTLEQYIEAGRMLRHEQDLTQKGETETGRREDRAEHEKGVQARFEDREARRAGEFDIRRSEHEADRAQRLQMFQGSQEAKGLARADVERRFQQRESRLQQQFAKVEDDKTQAAKDRRDRLALEAAAKARAGDLAGAKAQVDLWDKENREYDRIMRAKISAMANLPKAQQQEMLKELDAAFNQQQAAMERIKAGQPAAAAPAGAPAATAPAGGPAPGTVQDGYRFKGGDPSQQSNWEKI